MYLLEPDLSHQVQSNMVPTFILNLQQMAILNQFPVSYVFIINTNSSK